MSNPFSTRLLALLLALAASAPRLAFGEDAIGRAHAFLTERQLETGGFVGATVVDAVEAIRVMRPGPERDAAIVALFLSTTEDAQSLFARLNALTGSPYRDPQATALAAAILQSGILGLAPGHASPDPLVLAEALRYVVDVPELRGPFAPAIIAALATFARPDGSFAFADNDGELALTAEIVRALDEANGIPGAWELATAGRAWLAAQAAGSRGSLAAADLGLLLSTAGSGDRQLLEALVVDLQAIQGAEGGFDGATVRSTALAIAGLGRGLPDLRIKRPALDLAEAVTGEPLVRTVLVSNVGLSASLPTRIDYRLTSVDGTVRVSGSSPVVALAPGQTVSIGLDLGIQGSPGEVTFEGIVNPTAEMAEGELDLNVLRFGFRIDDLADLVVTPTDVSVSPSPPLLHEENRISVRIRNVGEALAHDVHVQIFAGEPGAGGVLLGESILNAVAAGTPRTFSTTWVPRTADPVRIVVRVDPGGTVRERDDANNATAVDLTPRNPAEFAVDLWASLRPLLPSVTQGEWNYLEYTVIGRVNRFGNPHPWDGLWPFDSVLVVIYDGPSEFLRTRLHLISSNGAATSLQKRIDLPADIAAGVHHFRMVVDPENEIDDLDRTNNVVSLDVNVVNPGLPELYVAALDADFIAVAQGTPSTLRARVKNSGVTDAVALPVSITMPNRVAWHTVPLVAPGEVVEISEVVAYEDLAQAGSEVVVRIDPDGLVSESTKSNNSRGIYLYRGVGDARVDSVVQIVSPVSAGSLALLDVAVRNDSTTRCWSFWTMARLVPGGQLAASKYSIEPLDPRESRTIRLEMETTGFIGPQRMEATVSCDAAAVRPYPFELNVGNADFEVGGPGIAISPERVGPGGSIVPRILVTNLGNIADAASVRVYRGYPEQGDLASSGQVYVDAGGTAQFEGPAFAAPGAAPFVITAVVDEENAITELDEWNNSGVRTTLKPRGETLVAFDEIHLPGSTLGENPDAGVGGITGNLTDFARDLLARGYDVVALNPDVDTITPMHLRGVDVLVIVGPSKPFTEAELRLLREYVERGGGLFFLGDHLEVSNPPFSWVEPELQIASTFGFTADRTFVHSHAYCPLVWQSFWRNEGRVRPHAITTGVEAIWAQWIGSFSGLPQGAEVLVQAGPDWNVPNAIVSAVFPFGEGRVALHGDANLTDADFTPPDPLCGQAALYWTASNGRLARQVVDWLAKGGTADWKPDLTFNPSKLLVSKDLVVDGETVTLTSSVWNVGGGLGSAEATIVRLYDGPPAPENLVAEKPVPALAMEQGHEITFTWSSALLPGRHVLTAVVDPDGTIDEQAEDNNAVTAEVFVRRDLDLRVDPSDIAVIAGDPPQIALRVHNVGYDLAPAGARVVVERIVAGGKSFVAEQRAPAIPARGAVSLAFTWDGSFPQTSFEVQVTVNPPDGAVDPDPSTNVARRELAPPQVNIHVPLAGTRWGGRKSVHFGASSLTRPNLTCAVAFGREGAELTGVPGWTCDRREIDTTRYPDGAYLLRVVASDGLQSSQVELPVRIDNATLAVRTFGSAPGVQSVTLAPGIASSSVSIPVGSRVTSATMTVVPVVAPYTTINAAAIYGGAPVVRFRGSLHVFYVNAGALLTRVSYDDGATWTDPVKLSGPGTAWGKAAAVNGSGIHLVYSDAAGIQYRRSMDGRTWSASVVAAVFPGTNVVNLTATEEGLALVLPLNHTHLAVADAAGETWGPLARLQGWYAGFASAALRRGKLHLVHGEPYFGYFYRSVASDQYRDQKSYSAPAQIVEPGNGVSAALFTDTEIVVAGTVYPTATTLQRCSLERNCEDRDEWLPEPIAVSRYQDPSWLAERSPGVLQYLHLPFTTAYGIAGGAAWSEPTVLEPATSAADASVSVFEGAVLMTGRTWGLELFRRPGLTPTDVSLDIGADADLDLVRAGMLGAAAQSGDLAMVLNAYLAAHRDADDGASDGFVKVPVAVTSAGAGQLQLADLEIAYVPATAVGAFAEPPLFSPTASPGILDTTVLSMVTADRIVVTDAGGAPRRTLTPIPSGIRFDATFDGRDDGGRALPSGRYHFGPAGNSLADVEVDDVPPTVALEASDLGSYGGLAEIHGTASDADFAGTPRNFARYVLEYSTGGSLWTAIASATSPAHGVLGRWDTRRMAAGPVTLRLTAYDRAGNSATTSRVVGVSPDAPLAPVIDAPTVAGRPYESLTSSVTVAGVAEPATTVVVYVNGVAAGSVPCDGRWSAPGIVLPAGVSSITASATRGSLESVRSEPIVVARYEAGVVLALPSSAPVDTGADGMVTVSRTSAAGGSLTVRISARDGAGQPVDLSPVPREQALALAPSGTATFAVHVGGPAVRAGTYTIVAEIVSGALVPARAEREIALEASQELDASLASDKAVYGTDDVVALEARLTSGAAAPTGELTASIVVLTPEGRTVVLGPFDVPPIAPGATRSVGALFGQPPLAAGSYAAELLVTDAWSGVLATASTTFSVRPAIRAEELAGRLLVNPTTYWVGRTLNADWAITRSAGEGPVDVALLLVRAADGRVFARHDVRVPIGAGATVSGTAALATTDADGNEIVAVLLGNGKGLAAQAIDSVPVADTTPPAISIEGFDDGEYRSGPVTPVILVADESPFTSEASLGGAPFESGTAVDADGEYVVSVYAVDTGGNASDASKAFTIDTIAPEIVVSGVTDGDLTNASVFASVQVSDLHPDRQLVTLDDVEFDGLPVVGEGDHFIHVEAWDLAENRAERTVRFTIDKTAPVIAVGGVADGGLYGASVRPDVSVSDAHPGSPPWTAALDGSEWLGAEIATDGDFVLVVSATDAAGNTASPVEVRFGVDRAPPVIRVSGVTDGLLTRGPIAPVVAIDEPHPGSETVELDGQPFVSGTQVSGEGEHVLLASAVDALGHVADPVRIRFVRDSTPPTITISGVAEGESYLVDATPTFAVSETHPGTDSATLDGAPFASGTTVAANGWHTLRVEAIDLAGNTSVETVTFEIVSVRATLTAALDANARVLVVLNCDRRPPSCEQEQGGVLLSALSSAGISHDVALDRATFLEKLRQNRHNVRVVYRSAPPATNWYGELRELTYAGGGLVVVNDAQPDNDPKLEDAIGVHMTGAIKSVGTMSLAAGDLGPERTIAVAGPGVVQKLVSPTAGEVGKCVKGAVVTAHRYGNGRAVTLTFDPEQNDAADVRDLLVRAVRFAAAGSVGSGVPGAPQYVTFTSALDAPPGPLAFRLDAWTGVGLVPFDENGAPSNSPRTWVFQLGAGGSAARTLAVSSARKGTYPVLGELALASGSGATRILSRASVDVSIGGSIEDLKDAAIAATQRIPARCSTARAATLATLGAVDPSPGTRTECETSITAALDATDVLASATCTEAGAARLATDQLLRALQVLYPTLP